MLLLLRSPLLLLLLLVLLLLRSSLLLRLTSTGFLSSSRLALGVFSRSCWRPAAEDTTRGSF